MNIKDDFILSNINEGYLVGGTIRDFLMGKTSADRDISIKDARDFALKLSKELDATFIVLDSENQIYRIVLKDKINYLDISEMQGNSIEEDLSRRDFRINAIAYDLKQEKYIDPFNGIEDIKTKQLRHIKDENFEDDPLRILRAFRFLATTGFEMDAHLKSAINKYKHLVLNPSKERIMYEIMKLFGGDYATKALIEMDNFGILEELFPIIKDVKKVPENQHHHLDLFHHSIETVRIIEKLYKEGLPEEKEHLKKVDFGGFPRINHLKLAGFLHDIGKFSCWTIDKDGRHRFIKHEEVGAKMCEPILRDLKFSKKQVEYISIMIKKHMYPSNVIDAPILNDKVMMRYVRKIEDNLIDNIILAKADRLSARGEAITEEIINTNINGLNKLRDFYLEKRESLKPLPKLLDGKEIMEILNLKPSPRLGEIIEALKEAQISGDVLNKDDAIKFIKNL